MRRVFLTLLLTLSLFACIAAARVSILSASAMQGQSQEQGNPDIRVWVDTAYGFYHCPGSKWYGNTKQGAYMKQKEAQDRGYRPAYGAVCK